MPFRAVLFFVCFILALFFYPGANPYITLLAFHRELLEKPPTPKPIAIRPVPVILSEAAPPFISAQGVYVVEADTLTPLFARQEHVRFFPASITKIITALVARELYQPDDIITVKTATTEGQLMGLTPNERISFENLLYGLLVHSGNDAAYAIAGANNYDSFISRMNAKAQELGMKASNFANPAGLDDHRQLTTPFDLALAARALLAQPYLKKIVGTKEIIISDVDYKQFHKLTNVNKLLGEIKGLGGLKTGYTEAAGENLVSFYRHEGHDFIIVVMKSEDRFADTTAIVNWLDANITFVQPL